MLRLLLPAITAFLFLSLMVTLYLLNRYHFNQLESYIHTSYALNPEATSTKKADAVYDIRENNFFNSLPQLIKTLNRDKHIWIKIIGNSKTELPGKIEIITHSQMIDQELYRVFNMLLIQTLTITAIFGLGLFFLLDRFLVRPLKLLTYSINRFEKNPEMMSTMIAPNNRKDEIGQAQRSLATMQRTLMRLLQEKKRLASVGLAVSKINHDLRNILSNAQLISDSLVETEDLALRAKAQRLISSLGRGIALCTQYLNYARPKEEKRSAQKINLHKIIDEVGKEVLLLSHKPCQWVNKIPETFEIKGDSNHLFRILFNLAKNAIENETTELMISAQIKEKTIDIEIQDNGLGLSLRARTNLFLPFKGSGDKGLGLGLPIAQELARDLGGDLALKETRTTGTVFRLTLPYI